MAQKCAIGLMSALAAAASLSKSNIASADRPLNFSGFSTSPTPQAHQGSSTQPTPGSGKESSVSSEDSDAPPRIRNDNPRTTSDGFDPEALERGAKALKGINNSAHAKKVFESIKTQEETRQAEFTAKAQEFKALQSQAEAIPGCKVMRGKGLHTRNRRNLLSTKHKLKHRWLAKNEAQRTRNQELVKMQEESAIRREVARRATKEEIQAQRRQTEREKVEIERETIRVKAMAEAEGRARESKLSEDVNKRMLVDRANAEEKNGRVSFSIGGLRMILTDQNKLVVAVGGITALAAGIYTTREGAKVIWSYVDRVLGQPSLIRESSRGKYPWSGSNS
ncbi:unnamed protein product [Eruca vesicaria subsp. sativa]|uniref:ATPase family AAA domain-containing protein n=1 Tax=Eruca vesicaria subsp. sativa TaxID=29727 RepID=A0ABC8LRD8_ERUVS|nr:unnamed protein product [Eruca vesicaria subsp. sativa]